MIIKLQGDDNFKVIDIQFRAKASPIRFPYGRIISITLEFYHDDKTPYDDTELSIYTTWQFGIDDDYNFSTDPAVLTISDFVVSDNKLIFLTRTDTPRFLTILNNAAYAASVAELKGYLPGEPLSSFGTQFPVQLRNAVIADGTAPPPENPNLYFTSPEVLALVAAKLSTEINQTLTLTDNTTTTLTLGSAATHRAWEVKGTISDGASYYSFTATINHNGSTARIAYSGIGDDFPAIAIDAAYNTGNPQLTFTATAHGSDPVLTYAITHKTII